MSKERSRLLVHRTHDTDVPEVSNRWFGAAVPKYCVAGLRNDYLRDMSYRRGDGERREIIELGS